MSSLSVDGNNETPHVQEWSSSDVEDDSVVLVSRQSCQKLLPITEESSPAMITGSEGDDGLSSSLGGAEDVCEFGMRCESMCLETTDSEVDDAKPANKKLQDSYAVLVRQATNQPAHSIVVQSPLINTVLLNAFTELHCNYMDFNSITVSLEAPFDPVVLCWPSLLDAAEHHPSDEVKSHVKVLIDAVKPALEDSLEVIDVCNRYHAIAHDYLWAIYKPGEILYMDCNATNSDATRLVRIIQTRYTRSKAFEVISESITWSGSEYVLFPVYSTIEFFEGTCDIKSLNVSPLRFHPDKEKIREAMLRQGQKVEKLRGFHFKSYTGRVLGRGLLANYSNEHVVFDASSYYKSEGQIRFGLFSPLIKEGHLCHVSAEERTRPRPASRWDLNPGQNGYCKVHQTDDIVDLHAQRSSNCRKMPNENHGSLEGNVRKNSQDHDTIPHLTEDQLLILSPFVDGYLLKYKRWGLLNIDNVTDIEQNNFFDKLVLPNGEKNLILALVEEQMRSKSQFDDSIRGKGKSLVILLKGPSGVGKTFTAESIAEKLNLPLFLINLDQMENFESRPEELGDFNNANAIFLLEETEIFLENPKHKPLSYLRFINGLFRNLDSFQGMLFITSNHTQPLEPAITSRIDLTINITTPGYPERHQIWSNSLARELALGSAISQEEIHTFAEMNMNGRDIDSVMKLAKLLAKRKGDGVGVEHVWWALNLKGY